MSAQTILGDDWSDYDNRKKVKTDRLFFSCEEDWEVDYLVRKIRKHHPGKSEEDVRRAIQACCGVVRAPRPRKDFVECVSRRLGI